MNEQQYDALMERLDLISKALFLNLVRDLEFKEKVIILNKMGLKESEIIILLGEKRGRVNSVLRDLND